MRLCMCVHTNKAPSLSAACGCASPSTFMSLKNTFCWTVAPTSRKIGALCQGRSFLHPATAPARRPRTSSWAWPLRHLQQQTELADQRSEQMWWDGELKARGRASQSGSRIPPRVGAEVSPSSSSAAGQHGNLRVVRVRNGRRPISPAVLPLSWFTCGLHEKPCLSNRSVATHRSTKDCSRGTSLDMDSTTILQAIMCSVSQPMTPSRPHQHIVPPTRVQSLPLSFLPCELLDPKWSAQHHNPHAIHPRE